MDALTVRSTPPIAPPTALHLEHLLQPFGLDVQEPGLRVKLVRHMDQQVDVWQLYRAGQLDSYQAFQSKPVLDGADLILSFLGMPANHAVFIGAYTVGARSSASAASAASADLSGQQAALPPLSAATHHYHLEPLAGLEALQERVVIDWGRGALAWVQWFRPGTKPVVEVLPHGYTMEFPGYLDVKLSFHELQRIIQHPVAHREWHRMLGAVAGVYLVLDTRTGNQYVGSAYGSDGILGRWRSYAKNGHGDNKKLVELVQASSDAPGCFQFAILQTLPTTLTAREVIDYEKLHKDKLGSRAHGLNSN